MDADSFTDLALRVVAGEVTDDERRTLEAAMASQPMRRAEYDQLKITHRLLTTAAPMLEATRATGPELPAYRVNELRTAVRQHFGPAVRRQKADTPGRLRFLRWLSVGGSVTVLAQLVLVLFSSFSNRSIEVGLYQTDTVRGDNAALTATDIPSAKIVSFTQDAPFDQWQSQPLAWTEKAKIWVDNERDLLYIVHRVQHGEVVMETKPLAPTNEGQREQIRQAVESLGK